MMGSCSSTLGREHTPCSQSAQSDSLPLPRARRSASAAAPKAKTEKTSEQIQKDIQDIMRQITSSVTFLPTLEEQCASSSLWHPSSSVPLRVQPTSADLGLSLRSSRPRSLCSLADVFTILTYAKKDTEVPKEWIDSDPHMIIGNAEQVRALSLPTRALERAADTLSCCRYRSAFALSRPTATRCRASSRTGSGRTCSELLPSSLPSSFASSAFLGGTLSCTSALQLF